MRRYFDFVERGKEGGREGGKEGRREGGITWIFSRNSARRSMPAEKAERASNWFTMRERSERMWLKAE